MKGLAFLALLGSPAYADEQTGVDVAGAPRPGEESGRIDAHDDSDSAARELGRGLLVLPRVAFEVAFAPVRAGFWAYERYQLRDRWFATFFNDARTIGLYPTLAYDSTTGILAGVRFVARDMFGAKEHLALRAATGGRDREVITGAIRSGERLGRLSLELIGQHERRANAHFYGVGNASDMKVDYGKQQRRAAAILDLQIARDLHVRAAGALTSLELETDEPMLGDLRDAYGELELNWDSRGRYTRWEPGSLASIGTLASIYGGPGVVEDGQRFWRLGAEAQHFLRIANGPRVIATRLHLETVHGDAVPVHELARLGGSTLLRGYPTDRYRDHAAAVGTLEYRWDIARFMIASCFVDAGRVAPAVSGLDLDALHVGYGIGLDLYAEKSFVVRASLATSIDGGLIVQVSFDPAFEFEPRVLQ